MFGEVLRKLWVDIDYLQNKISVSLKLLRYGSRFDKRYHNDKFVNHNSFFEGSISKIHLYMYISRYFAVHLFRLKMDKSSNHFDSQLPASTKLHSIY